MGATPTFRRLEDDDLEADDLVSLEPHEAFSSEKQFEDALVSNPSILVDGLWLVGRQIQTDAGRIDLLGVDAEGALLVFELKLGQLSRGAVSQAIEYAAFLCDLGPDDLFSLISNSSGRNGIALISDFADEFEQRFGRRPSEDGLFVRTVLVSQEYDEPSARSIDWLSHNGIAIEHFVLRGARTGNTVVFDVLESIPPPIRRWWYPPAQAKRPQLVEWLFTEAAKTESADLHAEIAEMVIAAFPSGRWVPRTNPNSLGLNWQVSGTNGKPVESVTIRIYNHDPDQIFLMLFDEVLQYAPDELRSALQPFIYGEGTRLGKPHGEVRWIDAETWAEHGQALRDALAYAGANHAKAVG